MSRTDKDIPYAVHARRIGRKHEHSSTCQRIIPARQLSVAAAFYAHEVQPREALISAAQDLGYAVTHRDQFGFLDQCADAEPQRTPGHAFADIRHLIPALCAVKQYQHEIRCADEAVPSAARRQKSNLFIIVTLTKTIPEHLSQCWRADRYVTPDGDARDYRCRCSACGPAHPSTRARVRDQLLRERREANTALAR